MKELSEIEIDALTEIINIGVGKAASSLHDIIGTHIVLKVPRIELFPLEKLPEVVSRLDQKSVSSVLQSFQGDFTGSAALIFPPESAVRLVSALTGDEIASPSLDSVRGGTLMEIGNIVINSILGTMGNILECNLNFSLPEYRDINKIVDLIAPPTIEGAPG
ncbi:chemotaxis protein CheX, partial [Thermodesulfobacteriota bacterium]